MGIFYGYSRKNSCLGLVCAGIFLLFNSSSQADNWKTGRALQTALQGKIRFQSTGTLKEDVASLSKNSQVAIYLDREIDPTQKIEFPSDLQPLGQTLEEVAVRLDGLSLTVGSFVYIAPRQKALRFLVLRNMQSYLLKSWPPEVQQRMQQLNALEWNDLANPADLIQVISANCDLEIDNATAIPHDLWASQRLTRLPHWEQLAFLLACMNCTFQVDGANQSLKVIPIDSQQLVTLRFNKKDSRKIKNYLRQLRLNDIQQAMRDDGFFVRGSLDDTSVLIDKMRPQRKWKSEIKAGSKDVFDLNTYASRGSILATIAKNRKVELHYDPKLVELLNQKVKIEVKQATLDELLNQTLAGSGMDYQLTEKQLIISN